MQFNVTRIWLKSVALEQYQFKYNRCIFYRTSCILSQWEKSGDCLMRPVNTCR